MRISIPPPNESIRLKIQSLEEEYRRFHNLDTTSTAKIHDIDNSKFENTLKHWLQRENNSNTYIERNCIN